MHSRGATLTNRHGWAWAELVLAAGIIERARRRQHRRQLRIAALVLGAIAAGVIAYVVSGAHGVSGASDPSGGARPVAVAPSSVLAHSRPYMGIACPRANSIACGRVGFAVWLRRPAVAVTATIAGRSWGLHGARADSPTIRAAGPRKAFTGYLHLQPAVIVNRLHAPVEHCPNCNGVPGYCAHSCDINPARPSPVTLRIRYPNDEVVTTRILVALQPGWG